MIDVWTMASPEILKLDLGLREQAEIVCLLYVSEVRIAVLIT